MHQRICICDVLPTLHSTTRLLLLIHLRETYQTSNTGHLLPLAMPSCEMRIYGDYNDPMSEEGLVLPGHQTYLLFPGHEAKILTREEIEEDGRPVSLIVPDATWRQASRMMRRCTPLHSLPRRILPPGPPSRYKLRRSDDPSRLSTFEAAARALGILEGPTLQQRLEDEVFQVMIDRSLLSLIHLDADKVTGGLPNSALEDL